MKVKKIGKPIAVIGAGLAGLTAANFLRHNDTDFVLYEAGKRISGLAASFKDAEGFSYDFGAHFITNRLAGAIGVSSECRTIEYYGETVWLKGKIYKYPVGLMKVPRMAFSGAVSKFKSFGNGSGPRSAADWFRKKYGTVLADTVALPLIEAWSGAKADDLSPSLGESLPGSIGKTLYLKAASRVLGRAVACGYNREMPEKASVWHVYPERGVSVLCEKLAEGLEDRIKLETPVEEILVENEKVVAIKAKGETKEVSAVISTAPANILAKLVRGTNSLEHLKKFRYRPMLFVNMRFSGRGLLPDTVVWFPGDEFPFFRLTEATISMPWLAPEGKTIITIDIGCEKGDEFWTMDEESVTEICLEHMAKIIPGARAKFLGANVLRTPIAYPVFLNEYENERKNFERSTGIDNLLSIGRNGEFAHIFMEDVYWRTRRKVGNLMQRA
ncbi:MAG: FAD-dependent oxidoreductase [Saprospiraceae bacterium]|nr:FAD-dependent oxidoreductase [Pyrinomonadaceae bacterium]